MLIKNDFLNHWKTTLLRKRMGDGPALLAVLSLWTYCEQRRAWQFNLNALELAGVCNFGGDPAELRHHLMEMRFILDVGDGFWEVSGWGEANASLVAKWPGRRLTGDEYYHPQGFISKHPKSAIPTPIAQATPRPTGLATGLAIGFDRIGSDWNPPVAPQGGHNAAEDSATDSTGSSLSTRKSEVLPGKKRKGWRGERKPVNGVKSWAERKSEADQAQEDELAAIPRLPLDDHEPAWPWREISDKLYGRVWADWRDVPEDNRREMRAHFDKHPANELQPA